MFPLDLVQIRNLDWIDCIKWLFFIDLLFACVLFQKCTTPVIKPERKDQKFIEFSNFVFCRLRVILPTGLDLSFFPDLPDQIQLCLNPYRKFRIPHADTVQLMRITSSGSRFSIFFSKILRPFIGLWWLTCIESLYKIKFFNQLRRFLPSFRIRKTQILFPTRMCRSTDSSL